MQGSAYVNSRFALIPRPVTTGLRASQSRNAQSRWTCPAPENLLGAGLSRADLSAVA